jgi:hypothetical protein
MASALPFKVRNSVSSARAYYTGAANMWSATRISFALNRQPFGQNAMNPAGRARCNIMTIAKDSST